MVTSPPLPSGSHPDIVEEHAEEVTFLYGQRRYLLDTGQGGWDRLGPIEDRLGVHLVGLGVAGPYALDLAIEAATTDTAAAFAAVRLQAQVSPSDVLALSTTLDGDGARAAILDALRLPPSLPTDVFVDALPEPESGGLAAAILADRRAPVGAELLGALASADDLAHQADLIRALGTIRYPPARSTLVARYLRGPTPALAQVAATALLRFGDEHALREFEYRIGTFPSAPLAVAVLGGRSHGPALVDALHAGDHDGALAVGVLGDGAHVPPLLLALDQPDGWLAYRAALALRVLTGADLVEDRLLPDDLSAPEEGGDVVVWPSTDVGTWQTWWGENAHRFSAGTRYRNGLPFTPGNAVSQLADTVLPAPLRDALADELAGRYGLDAPFRADAFVAHQRAALGALADAAATVRASEGEWATSRRPAAHGR